MSLTIKTDLKADMEACAKRFFDLNPNLKYEPTKELFPQWCALRHKLIDSKPRKVIFSKNFKIPVHLQAGLNALVLKLQNGENVNPHLNKTSVDPNEQDGMLNDFGIHHFHLGANLEGDFMERTGEVAFVLINQDTAFFIDAPLHGRGSTDPLVWNRQKHIQTIHDEQPHLLEAFRVHGSIKANTYTDEQRSKLRKLNFNPFTQVNDGTCYISPGFGTVISGDSTRSVREYLLISTILKERFKHAEELLRSSIKSPVNELVLKMVDFEGQTQALDVLFEVIMNGQVIAMISSEYIGDDKVRNTIKGLNAPTA